MPSMDATPLAPAKPKRRTKPSKPDRYREQILRGLDSGLSQRQVAANLGIASSTICEWLNKIDQEKHELSRYRSTRADALSQIQSKALSLQAKILDGLMMDGLPEDASVSQKSGLLHTLTVVAGTSFDKERLETGQSTQNLSVFSRLMDAAVADIYKPAGQLRRADSQPVDSHPADITDDPASE